MPDATSAASAHLQEAAIAEYWANISESLKRLLDAMDAKETWAVDGDAEFVQLLAKVAELMEDESFVRLLDRGENTARMAEALALTRSSRFMRLLEMFDKRQPGVVSRLVMSMARLGGEMEVFARLFYERLLTVHRAELLGQIFSVQRSQRIANDVNLVKEIVSESNQ